MVYRAYVATNSEGVYYAPDFAIDSSHPTWTKVNDGLPTKDIRQLVCDRIDPENCQYVMLSGTRTIYRRLNQGNWTSILTEDEANGYVDHDSDIIWMATSHTEAGYIYVIVSDGFYDVNLLISNDYGATWSRTLVHSGAIVYGGDNVVASGDIVWVTYRRAFGASGCVKISIDGGATFSDEFGYFGQNAVGYIQWRPEIDSNYIVVGGAEGGGTRPCWYSAVYSAGSVVVTLLNDINTPIYDADSLWISSTDLNDQRAVGQVVGNLLYTDDEWDTYSNNNTNDYGGGVIASPPGDDVTVIFSVDNNANMYPIGYIATESSTDRVNKSGAAWNSSPYVNSIPNANICGGISHTGIWLFLAPTPAYIYVHAAEGIPVTTVEIPEPGDRAVWDVGNYDTLHGSDIAADELKRHLPNPIGQLDGSIAVVEDNLWVIGTQVGSSLDALFLYNDASAAPATYKQMLPAHSAEAKETISVAGLTDGTVIEEFVSDSGSPNSHFLLDGIYHVHIHAAKTAGTKILQIYAEIYIRTDPGGVETLLGTTSTSTALTAAEAAYDLDLALSENDIDPTDRLVVKIVANVAGAGTNPTGALYVEGDTFSRFEFPALAIADGTIDSGSIRSIAFIIDGGGSAITTGVKGDLEIPFTCTINRATLLADQSGSIVVDIWKDTYANYPPTDADSITASTPPTLSSAIKSQDSTLTGWNISINAGDTLRFNVDSATTVTRVTLSLKVTQIAVASLIVQSGSHTHTADKITLPILTVQNGSHTHTAESIALGLDIQAGSHTHTADSPTLT